MWFDPAEIAKSETCPPAIPAISAIPQQRKEVNDSGIAEIARIAAPVILKIKNQAANDTEQAVDNLICFAWLIHFTHREPVTVTFSPEVNHAGALACYPDAVAAEPIQHPPMGGASELSPNKGKIDKAQLRALIEAVYRDDTESDRNEALNAALADPDNALVCYTAIASEHGLPLPDTDRHTCRQCANYTYSGMCSIATPGGLVSAQRGYRPGAMFQEQPHRCLAFKPKGQS